MTTEVAPRTSALLPSDDFVRLCAFEAALDPGRALPAGTTIIGWGEISTVFVVDALPGRVLKRMAGFRAAEVAPYIAAVEGYCAALGARGVAVVDTLAVPVALPDRHPVVYLVQPALAAESIGHRVVRDGDDASVRALLDAVLGHVDAVLAHTGGERLGLDAQVSNWAWRDGRALYLDVSTPLMRAADGRECLDPAIALRSMPAPLAWGFERWALREILDRYYDPREVMKDVAANFSKEGRADRLPLALAAIAEHLHERVPSAREVRRYYRRDARMWRLFQLARRLDRFWQTRVRRRGYDYLLPGRVAR